MKILVLAKQVPATTDLTFGENGVVDRSSVPKTVNPDDESAVELAIQMAESVSGEVILATMGPESASEMLSELGAMGCASCYHVSDNLLNGADLVATANVFAALAKKVNAEMVICGASAADGKGGLLPSAIASLLGWDCLNEVSSVEDFSSEPVVIFNYQGKKTKAKVKGSSVLSVYKTVAEPRIPDVMAVLSAPQPESLAVSDLDINEKALKFNDRCEILNVENVKKERKNKIWEGIESFSDFHTELKKEGF
ncbi:hypothetical protein CL645_03665 [bacterium]|nr:hypothetical protein [bacterium]|tara:strand:- start:352 stop:1110 length:759 start_codon:yes stop_codon:yes gene_type:complete